MGVSESFALESLNPVPLPAKACYARPCCDHTPHDTVAWHIGTHLNGDRVAPEEVQVNLQAEEVVEGHEVAPGGALEVGAVAVAVAVAAVVALGVVAVEEAAALGVAGAASARVAGAASARVAGVVAVGGSSYCKEPAHVLMSSVGSHCAEHANRSAIAAPRCSTMWCLRSRQVLMMAHACLLRLSALARWSQSLSRCFPHA
jgi:hypothetical protein